MRDRLHVLTPLYDPTGIALPWFEACASSVIAQQGDAFRWTISVQSAHGSYETLLQKLREDVRVHIVDASHVGSLGQHLRLLLSMLEAGEPVHLLCQDDRYLHDTAVLQTLQLLQRFPHLSLKARKWLEPSSPLATIGSARVGKRISPLNIFREVVGINRLGGLSTIAWVHSDLIINDLLLDLYADLELRHAIGVYRGLPLRVSGLVEEGRWVGQSQFSSWMLRDSESEKWVAKSTRQWAAAKSALAALYGDEELAICWGRRSRQPRAMMRLAHGLWWMRSRVRAAKHAFTNSST